MFYRWSYLEKYRAFNNSENPTWVWNTFSEIHCLLSQFFECWFFFFFVFLFFCGRLVLVASSVVGVMRTRLFPAWSVVKTIHQRERRERKREEAVGIERHLPAVGQTHTSLLIRTWEGLQGICCLKLITFLPRWGRLLARTRPDVLTAVALFKKVLLKAKVFQLMVYFHFHHSRKINDEYYVLYTREFM